MSLLVPDGGPVTVAIFPDHGLRWQHFRGDGTTFGAQHIYEPGHDPAVTWILPGEDPDDL